MEIVDQHVKFALSSSLFFAGTCRFSPSAPISATACGQHTTAAGFGLTDQLNSFLLSSKLPSARLLHAFETCQLTSLSLSLSCLCRHKLYYVLLAFGRPNLFANSYGFLLKKAKPGLYRNLELVGILFFWCWFTALLRGLPSPGVRVMYVLACFITTSPLHVQVRPPFLPRLRLWSIGSQWLHFGHQIVLSHFGQSTEDLGPAESFPHRQLRTTMDVDCPTYLDWMHGGLHMQVSHHLFPRVPRHNLRAVNSLVQGYVQKFEHLGTVRYETHTFVKGNKKVLGVLAGVASQVKALQEVAKENVNIKAQEMRAQLKE